MKRLNLVFVLTGGLGLLAQTASGQVTKHPDYASFKAVAGNHSVITFWELPFGTPVGNSYVPGYGVGVGPSATAYGSSAHTISTFGSAGEIWITFSPPVDHAGLSMCVLLDPFSMPGFTARVFGASGEIHAFTSSSSCDNLFYSSSTPITSIHVLANGPTSGFATLEEVWLSRDQGNEIESSAFCSSGAPCGNTDETAGCTNAASMFHGGMLSAIGSTSITADDLSLVANQIPKGKIAAFYASLATKPATPFGNGLRVLGPPTKRIDVLNTDGNGVGVTPVPSTGLTLIQGLSTPAVPGTTTFFQVLYRDPGGPCGQSTNATSALEVLWLP